MNRIPRHILFELLKLFAGTLLALTLVMLVVGVAQEALRQGLGPGPLLKLLPYLAPNALRFAAPGAMLFAACLVYGRVAASGELMALTAAGVSPWRVIAPGFVLALLVSLAAVWLNDVAVTWGRRGAQRVVVESVEEIVYGVLSRHRSYSSSRFSINVKDVQGRRLIRPMVAAHDAASGAPITLVAQEAELRCDLEGQALEVTLHNGRVEMGERGSLDFPDTLVHRVPLPAAFGGGGDKSPSQVGLGDLPREIARQHAEIERLGQTNAAEAAFLLLGGEFERLTEPAWSPRRRQVAAAQTRLNRLRTESWRRWANGFSCFFFVLVGCPLAIRMRSQDYVSTFFVCFLPILLIYYPLLALGVDRAKDGAFPPYSVWLANGLICAVGLWLLRRVL